MKHSSPLVCGILIVASLVYPLPRAQADVINFCLSHYLEVEAPDFFTGEINIRGSWTLHVSEGYIAYVQYRIFFQNGTEICRSPQYSEEGLIERNFSVCLFPNTTIWFYNEEIALVVQKIHCKYILPEGDIDLVVKNTSSIYHVKKKNCCVSHQLDVEFPTQFNGSFLVNTEWTKYELTGFQAVVGVGFYLQNGTEIFRSNLSFREGFNQESFEFTLERNESLWRETDELSIKCYQDFILTNNSDGSVVYSIVNSTGTNVVHKINYGNSHVLEVEPLQYLDETVRVSASWTLMVPSDTTAYTHLALYLANGSLVAAGPPHAQEGATLSTGWALDLGANASLWAGRDTLEIECRQLHHWENLASGEHGTELLNATGVIALSKRNLTISHELEVEPLQYLDETVRVSASWTLIVPSDTTAYTHLALYLANGSLVAAGPPHAQEGASLSTEWALDLGANASLWAGRDTLGIECRQLHHWENLASGEHGTELLNATGVIALSKRNLAISHELEVEPLQYLDETVRVSASWTLMVPSDTTAYTHLALYLANGGLVAAGPPHAQEGASLSTEWTLDLGANASLWLGTDTLEIECRQLHHWENLTSGEHGTELLNATGVIALSKRNLAISHGLDVEPLQYLDETVRVSASWTIFIPQNFQAYVQICVELPGGQTIHTSPCYCGEKYDYLVHFEFTLLDWLELHPIKSNITIRVSKIYNFTNLENNLSQKILMNETTTWVLSKRNFNATPIIVDYAPRHNSLCDFHFMASQEDNESSPLVNQTFRLEIGGMPSIIVENNSDNRGFIHFIFFMDLPPGEYTCYISLKDASAVSLSPTNFSLFIQPGIIRYSLASPLNLLCPRNASCLVPVNLTYNIENIDQINCNGTWNYTLGGELRNGTFLTFSGGLYFNFRFNCSSIFDVTIFYSFFAPNYASVFSNVTLGLHKSRISFENVSIRPSASGIFIYFNIFDISRNLLVSEPLLVSIFAWDNQWVFLGVYFTVLDDTNYSTLYLNRSLIRTIKAGSDFSNVSLKITPTSESLQGERIVCVNISRYCESPSTNLNAQVLTRTVIFVPIISAFLGMAWLFLIKRKKKIHEIPVLFK